ncbi:MAG TPA: ATP-grasp domain-containing protein [Anaerolineales bacterium]|jgi:hypothetical protein
MNYVSFSPHFPPNYFPFCVNLRKMGANVLGLADAPYDELSWQLKSSLTEYYRVSNALNYDELVRALGYFTHRYGKIDRLESHNEFWLENDARLRTDFNIPGFHIADMPRVKRKSEMKKMFIQSGIAVARGKVFHSPWKARTLVEEVGFPIVAKPDVGVGANKTYLLKNQEDLDAFFSNKPTEDFIFEEFIGGDIVTFDGLTNMNGEVVFCSAMRYSEGVMEVVNRSSDIWYYTERFIPEDLEAAGRKLVAAYNLKERFFHFEFFRTPEEDLVGLEVNMRPPGGLTTEMWNYSNDIDIYREYANVVVNNHFDAEINRPYYCGYIGRRLNKSYHHTLEELIAMFPEEIIHHESISGIFAAAIGDHGFLVRTPEFDRLSEIAWAVLEN